MTRDAAANLEADGVRAVVGDLTNLPLSVVNSHADWDHFGGNHRVDEVVIHHAEARDLPLSVANKRLRRAFAPEPPRAPLPEGFNIEIVSNPPLVVGLFAASIAPAMLPPTRDGPEAAAGGRRREQITVGRARLELDGFSILAAVDDSEMEGR